MYTPTVRSLHTMTKRALGINFAVYSLSVFPGDYCVAIVNVFSVPGCVKSRLFSAWRGLAFAPAVPDNMRDLDALLC